MTRGVILMSELADRLDAVMGEEECECPCCPLCEMDDRLYMLIAKALGCKIVMDSGYLPWREREERRGR